MVLTLLYWHIPVLASEALRSSTTRIKHFPWRHTFYTSAARANHIPMCFNSHTSLIVLYLLLLYHLFVSVVTPLFYHHFTHIHPLMHLSTRYIVLSTSVPMADEYSVKCRHIPNMSTQRKQSTIAHVAIITKHGFCGIVLWCPSTIALVDLWYNANKRQWYCNTVFVNCSYTRKLVNKLIFMGEYETWISFSQGCK